MENKKEDKMIKIFKIDQDKCKKCGICKKACPADAIEGKVKEPFNIVVDKCIKCGICETKCKFNAVLQSTIEADTAFSCTSCGEQLDPGKYNYVNTKTNIKTSINKLCPECRTYEIAKKLSAFLLKGDSY